MSKTKFACCISLLVVNLYLAQPLLSQNQFAIKAGPSFSTQTKEWRTSISQPYQNIETHFLVGYQFGVYYRVGLIKQLSLATEANLSMIGTKARDFYITIDGREAEGKDFAFKLGYIELPMLLQYELKKLQVAAGPGIGYKVYSTSVDNARGGDFLDVRSTSYHKLDFGLNAAVGYEIYKKFSVRARYYYGLADVEATEMWKIRNRYFNISALYALN